jgi:hypothetical protein
MTDLRPSDLAQLLLSGGDLLPRQRARDQAADLVGMELKRDVLQRLAALDPEPDALDVTLHQIIEDIGPPHGPTRGICLNIRYDWEAAAASPEFVAWLLDEAVRESQGIRRRKGRRNRQQGRQDAQDEQAETKKGERTQKP